MSSYNERAIKEFAEHLHSLGAVVFIAGRGTYGFFTDETEKRVVSFQTEFGSIVLSGNYEPTRECGSGWRMEGICAGSVSTPADVQSMLNTEAPRWAVGDRAVKYTTVEEHLKRYGQSSNYTRFEG